MHSGITATLIAAVALAAIAMPAPAAGSVEQGLALARAQCAACHLLGKEKGLSTDPRAPTFTDIANTPGMTAAALRVMLNTPHESMPNLVIRGEDADSLIAYILSLKDGR